MYLFSKLIIVIGGITDQSTPRNRHGSAINVCSGVKAEVSVANTAYDHRSSRAVYQAEGDVVVDVFDAALEAHYFFSVDRQGVCYDSSFANSSPFKFPLALREVNFRFSIGSFYTTTAFVWRYQKYGFYNLAYRYQPGVYPKYNKGLCSTFSHCSNFSDHGSSFRYTFSNGTLDPSGNSLVAYQIATGTISYEPSVFYPVGEKVFDT